MNMRDRFYGLVECLTYQAPNAAAAIASAANRPLPNATGGQKTPRRARGFPMWTFLTIHPRAGRNSRRYPRKFRAQREVQGKTRSLLPPGNSDRSELLPKADIGSGGGHVGYESFRK
jgi:hypothetical protein